MDRLTTFAVSSQVPAATLNAMQDRERGMRLASAAATGELSGMAAVTGGGAGTESRFYATPSGGWPTADLTLIDDSIDWRDRYIITQWINFGAANVRAGQANDYTYDGTLVAHAITSGYTGIGGLDAGGATPTAGNPPVSAAGKWRVQIAGTLWLYAEVTTFKLYVYNDTGAAVHGLLWVEATPDLAKR